MPVLKARISGAWVDVGGGGVDEVWIGTAAPTDTATELWYDTDEPNLYEPDTARWNSAWGNVVPQTANSDIDVAAGPTTVRSVTFTAVAGRRYVVRVLTASSYTTGQTVGQSFTTALQLDGVTQLNFVIQVDVNDNYQPSATTTVELTPAGGSRTVAIVINRNNGTGTFRARYALAIDDVGPVSLSSNPPAQPASVWTPVTFQNGWSNSGGTHQLGAYRLLGDQVQLRGLVKGGTNAAAIFTLPAGYRPTATVVAATNHIVGGNWAFGIVQIATDGAVAPFGSAAPTDVSLNNLSFSVL